MVITQPTVDDFSDTTVMRVIRKIVNYICNDLVDGINNNDIVSGQFSVQGNQLSGTLTKGDGTTINIPAATLPSGGGGSDNPYPTAVSMTLSDTTLNFNMTMSNGTPITGSVNLAPILEGYVTDAEISPTVTINENVTPPTITVAINGKSSTANLPSSKGNVTIENFQASNISTIISKLKSIPLGSIVLINVFNFGATSGAGTITYCSAFKVDSGGAFSANGALFYTSKSYPLTAFYVGSSTISIKYIDSENSEETLTWNSSSSFSATIISFK